MLTACCKLDNSGQVVIRQLVDGLFADLLQIVKFARVYVIIRLLMSACSFACRRLLSIAIKQKKYDQTAQVPDEISGRE